LQREGEPAEVSLLVRASPGVSFIHVFEVAVACNDSGFPWRYLPKEPSPDRDHLPSWIEESGTTPDSPWEANRDTPRAPTTTDESSEAPAPENGD
jgi:hypothetical protein